MIECSLKIKKKTRLENETLFRIVFNNKLCLYNIFIQRQLNADKYSVSPDQNFVLLYANSNGLGNTRYTISITEFYQSIKPNIIFLVILSTS